MSGASRIFNLDSSRPEMYKIAPLFICLALELGSLKQLDTSLHLFLHTSFLQGKLGLPTTWLSVVDFKHVCVSTTHLFRTHSVPTNTNLSRVHVLYCITPLSFFFLLERKTDCASGGEEQSGKERES